MKPIKKGTKLYLKATKTGIIGQAKGKVGNLALMLAISMNEDEKIAAVVMSAAKAFMSEKMEADGIDMESLKGMLDGVREKLEAERPKSPLEELGEEDFSDIDLDAILKELTKEMIDSNEPPKFDNYLTRIKEKVEESRKKKVEKKS